MLSLPELSDQIADTVARAAPAVLGVRTGRRVASGLAWSADGLVLTSVRALGRGDAEVRLADGSTSLATLVGADSATEIALLRLANPAALAPLPAAPAPRVGQLVLALGRPQGEVQAALGMVRAVGGAWSSPFGAPVDSRIDVDGELPGGFPGGPLVDSAGQLIGLNVRGLLPGGTTLDLPTLTRVSERLVRSGSPRRGYLGLGLQAVQLPPGSPRELGLLVSSVDPEGPAARGGALLGDVLLAIDGQPITSYEGLLYQLSQRTGQAVNLDILRAGQPAQLTVTIGERRGCC